jgi:hypothetical protein
MSTTPTHNPVPLRFAALLQTKDWYHCDYDRILASHRSEDFKTGITCVYNMQHDPQIESIEVLLGDEFTHEGGVNQHALHSLRLAIWEAQKAFAEHEKRLNALRGSPQGRIYKRTHT